MNSALLSNLDNIGFEVLSSLEKSTDFVLVRCKLCGNEFSAPYRKLQSKSRRCPCRRDAELQERRSINMQELSLLAAERGGKLLTTNPLNVSEKWEFQCSKGHAWEAVGTSIKAGTWCPKCGGSSPRNISELREIVSERGGQLLSDKYVGVDGKYVFRCNLGHEFENLFKKVESGQWCPTCSKGSKSEEIARTTFEYLFKVRFRKVRPTWLRNSRGRIMEIDGYNDELKIGFEYQGVQHFRAIGLYQQDIEQRKADDKLKFELCSEHGVRIFYLTHEDEYSDFPARILDQAKVLGVDIEGIDFDSPIDLSGAYVREDRLEELRVLLDAKNIKVLSTKWLTSNAKYKFECLTCGYTWEARGNSFFNSRSVSGCEKCSRKVTADANRGGLKDLVEFANGFSGEVVSKEYVQRRYVYSWICSKGHAFQGNFNNMKFRNEFCPICENRISKEFVSADEARALFLQSKLEMRGDFLGKRKLVIVQCQVCGKESKQTYQNLEDGKAPCSECVKSEEAKKAELIMLAAGAKPLVEYVDVSTPWLSECLKCHRQTKPSLSNVKRGQGVCFPCGVEKSKQTKKSRRK
jgi:hypothetical protein